MRRRTRIGASPKSGSMGSALEGLALGERGALGADLGGGLGDRAGLGEVVGREARLEQGAERAQLAAGRQAGALGVRVAVPGAREAGEAGAPAVSVRGEHRADAAVAIHIGADDDRVGVDALQHRLLGPGRQRLDGEAEALGGVSVAASHRPKG